MKIRVLVVDDSVVIRTALSEALGTDAEVEVAGTAANGKICLQKLPQLNPDIVVLDMEMPELNGIETLKEIRKSYPKLPVIMFSALTAKGASATLDALASGANDYITKPANVASPQAALENVREELLPKIKLFCGNKREQYATPQPPRVTRSLADSASAGRVDIIAIGVSTGGPNALAELIPSLPGKFPVPIVIVQHMPPLFTKYLAQRLSNQSQLTVKEGEEGEELQSGVVYIAPGGSHMILRSTASGVGVELNTDPPENSCRPAVDPLFRSVASIYKNRSLGIILTGMGQDGLLGCEHLRHVGSQVIVQDEATSVVWGMPGFVARAGYAAAVLPLHGIASEIFRRTAIGRSSFASHSTDICRNGGF